MSAEPQWAVTCQCGWRVQGTKDVVIAAVQEHDRAQHGIDPTPEQVMSVATRVGR